MGQMSLSLFDSNNAYPLVKPLLILPHWMCKAVKYNQLFLEKCDFYVSFDSVSIYEVAFTERDVFTTCLKKMVEIILVIQ